MFIEVAAFYIDIGEGINCGIGDEGIGNGCQSDLLIFIEGLMGTVGVGPLTHNLRLNFIYFSEELKTIYLIVMDDINQVLRAISSLIDFRKSSLF